MFVKKEPAARKIRQLCGLRPRAHNLIPRVLHHLHDYVPSSINVFAWVDENREIDHIYSESAEFYEVLPNYFELVKNGQTLDIFEGLAQAIQFRNSLTTDEIWKVDRRTFYRHSLYNEVFRPAGTTVALCRSIRSVKGAEGTMMLFRSANDSDYSTQEAKEVDKIALHIEYALSVQSMSLDDYPNAPLNSEIILVNSDCEIVYQSDGARQLLMMFEIEGHKSGPSSMQSKTGLVLTALVKNLMALSKGRDVLPPQIALTNKWGRFRATAFLMNPVELGQIKPLVTIQLEQFVPMEILLLEKLDQFKLTPRQRDVCLQISMRKPYSEIAKTLGISKSTVISHKKEIFQRLEINDRHQLADRVIYS